MFLSPIVAWSLGMPEMIFIALLALIIFGRRLPDVARSLGKSIVEFKKGLKDIESDVKTTNQLNTPDRPQPLPPSTKEHG